MLARQINPTEKEYYNKVVNHPLQSWEWGEFRKTTGVKVERIGLFEGEELKSGLQVTFHPIPHLGGMAGYLPRGAMPSQLELSLLQKIGAEHSARFIKLEPNVALPANQTEQLAEHRKYLQDHGAMPGRPLFTRYSFQLNIIKSEDELFANLKSKTRYNVNLAHRKGVTILEDSSQQGLEVYLEILAETTKRQGFYAHEPEYFQQMWQVFQGGKTLKIFHAVYDDQVLASWIMFVFNGVLYYPYGASRSAHREVMASNLLMWEMIKFGKTQGCHTFDMWGSLGPDASKKDKWYGFHKFKEGYGGRLVEFVGTYDLVLQPTPYKLFSVANDLRWRYLRLRARLGV